MWACKDNQQRWLSCCILGTTCKNYLSNYIGYTVDGSICLKIVTWSMPHLCHLFLVKSNCVISKENSGIISPLFLTIWDKSLWRTQNHPWKMVMLCLIPLEWVILISHTASVVLTLRGGDKRLYFILLSWMWLMFN